MKFLYAIIIVFFLASCKNEVKKEEQISSETIEKKAEAVLNPQTKNTLIYPEEKHFKNIRQVTFGGDNAEAYWSFDDSKIVFQSNYKDWGVNCDQMFLMNFDGTFKGSQPPNVSNGKGRTTCSYFMPDEKPILYASTHLKNEACPHVPSKNDGKYEWPIYDSFDIFIADLDGNIVKQLTDEPGDDPEATVSPKENKIVFTSIRSGSLL